MCRHGEPPSLGVPKHNVTRAVLIVIDAQPAGNDLQVLNPPVAWIAPHFLAMSFAAFDTTTWYHMRYHAAGGVPTSPEREAAVQPALSFSQTLINDW